MPWFNLKFELLANVNLIPCSVSDLDDLHTIRKVPKVFGLEITTVFPYFPIAVFPYFPIPVFPYFRVPESDQATIPEPTPHFLLKV